MHKRELLRTDEIIIRTADISDIGEIAALATELATQEGQVPHTTQDTLMRDVFCDAPACQMIVATKGIEVVGFLMFYGGYDLASACAGYHLGDVIVHALKRREGVGELLMKALAKLALDEGKDWVSWTVSKNNMPAKTFYLETIKAVEVEVDFMAMGKNSLRALTAM